MKDEPAFPHPEHWHVDDQAIHKLKGGLTKREYFAAMAMQGFCANSFYVDNVQGHHKKMAVHIAEDAIMCADALIKELERDA